MSAINNKQILEGRKDATIGLGFNCSKHSNIQLNTDNSKTSYDFDLTGIKVVYIQVLDYNSIANSKKLVKAPFVYQLIGNDDKAGDEIFAEELFLNTDPTIKFIRLLPFTGFDARKNTDKLGVIQSTVTFTDTESKYRGVR